MSDKTGIEWTDATWNPTTGCTKISPGCAHCYIERTPAFRIKGRTFVNGVIPLERHANRLEQPLHWRKPRRVFVNSLSDLFHEDVPDTFIDQVFAVMALAPEHTFQILTKRPERMRAYLSSTGRYDTIVRSMDMPPWMPPGIRFPRVPENWPLPNVWLGVSVENQHFADERKRPMQRLTDAGWLTWVSYEPALERVDFWDWLPREVETGQTTSAYVKGIRWLVVGGESGPGARPFDIAWARSIVQQCQAAGVACFVKQLGAQPVNSILGPVNPVNLRTVRAITDRKGGDPAEWPSDLRVREWPSTDRSQS